MERRHALHALEPAPGPVHVEPLGTGTRHLHHTGWGDGGEWDKTYAYFDRAWGNVLVNLKKRYDSGPMDWTAWMESLKKMHATPAAK